MRSDVAAIQLVTGPCHDVLVHAVLHCQHLTNALAIQILQPLKQRPAQALQEIAFKLGVLALRYCSFARQAFQPQATHIVSLIKLFSEHQTHCKIRAG